jgi:ABC-type uncharacterized transport system involved in gliding motility auxiliary subunit
MTARRYALIVFAALAAIFVASNVIVSSWFSGARLDLTENRIYTLSNGTKQALRGLNEPITLTFFYSRKGAAAYSEIRDYGARVRGLLRSYERQSGGRVRVIEVDPEPFSEAEDRAELAGMEPFQPDAGSDPIFIGLLGENAVDERLPLPQLNPQREPYLEYELTRLITELESPAKKRIGLITSLAWEPAMAGQNIPGSPPQPLVLTELMRGWNVVKVPADFAALDPDLDILAIIHPGPLTQTQLYAIDQFLMTRGRAFIALDPAAITANENAGFAPPTAPTASNLETTLAAWGVSLSADAVIDVKNALSIEVNTPDGRRIALPQPLYFAATPEQVDRDDLLTASITRGIYFGAPGALTWSEKPGVNITPLIRTSAETARIPAIQAVQQPQPQPQELLQNFTPSQKADTLALRITGKLPSAFGAARPADVSSEGLHKAQADGDVVIILASDVDFLSDGFYLSQPQRVPLMDNGAFAINSIDQLSGNAGLVSLRSRAPSLRRMDVVERIRSDAQRRALTTQETLQAELARTEEELRAISERGEGSGFFAGNLGAELTSEERTKIEELRAQSMEARAELRQVRRSERTDLERLEGWLVLLNVFLAPALVLGGGLFWLWRRQRRTNTISLKNGASS